MSSYLSPVVQNLTKVFNKDVKISILKYGNYVDIFAETCE